MHQIKRHNRRRVKDRERNGVLFVENQPSRRLSAEHDVAGMNRLRRCLLCFQKVGIGEHRDCHQKKRKTAEHLPGSKRWGHRFLSVVWGAIYETTNVASAELPG